MILFHRGPYYKKILLFGQDPPAEAGEQAEPVKVAAQDAAAGAGEQAEPGNHWGYTTLGYPRDIPGIYHLGYTTPGISQGYLRDIPLSYPKVPTRDFSGISQDISGYLRSLPNAPIF